MRKAKEITAQEWMVATQTRAVLDALQGEGKVPEALFVGGCVRNALLGMAVDDIDIATRWSPDEVLALLQAADIKAIPTGIEHGTVTAVVDGRSFEVTSLRRDVETDGRRAVVAYTKDWMEDAQRRDFTMNTLLADPQGGIYDPTGRGLADLEGRRVIFVGDPAQRIAEDYLRILRFFRFHAYYGEGDPDEAALNACEAAADKISTLSRERITQELFKILAVSRPMDALSVMFRRKVLRDLPADHFCGPTLSHLALLQEKYGVVDVIARLVVLADFERDHFLQFERYLTFSNAHKKEWDKLHVILEHLEAPSEKRIRLLLYRYERAYVIQAVLLYIARGNGGDISPELWALLSAWEAPAFPVNGEDVKKTGITQGPAIGEVLAKLEAWWIARDFAPDRKQCLAQMAIVCAGQKG